MNIQIEQPHQVTLRLSFTGFCAICSCGWRSDTSPSRQAAENASDAHKRRSQLRSIP